MKVIEDNDASGAQSNPPDRVVRGRTAGDVKDGSARRNAIARLVQDASFDPARRNAVAQRLQDASLTAMQKHLAEVGDLETIRHTIQVTSFGGTGTTALCEHLAAAGLDLPTTPGLFPFKHQRIPPDPEEVPAGFRVVYLYAEPRNAIVSLFRRSFQEGHYRWLRWRPPPEDARERLSSLEAFLEAGVDEFMLEDHLERWLTREPSGYQVLFCRFESLPDSWPVLRSFVGLSPDHPCMPLNPRRSDWQALPPTMRDQLDRLYGGLARRIDALPPVQIR